MMAKKECIDSNVQLFICSMTGTFNVTMFKYSLNKFGKTHYDFLCHIIQELQTLKMVCFLAHPVYSNFRYSCST